MDQTTEKIRRLLRLGTSSNKHEAQSALAKAAEIARRHSIDLGTIKADEERARVIEATFGCKRSYDVIERTAIQVCMGIFNVRCIVGGSGARFIGLPHNVEAARFARDFIMEQCGRDLKAFRKARRAALNRSRISKGTEYSFCQGWTYAVVDRYQAEIKAAEPVALGESSSALILREQEKEIDDYMEAQHSDVKDERKRRFKEDAVALGLGVRAGRKVSINRPVEGAQGAFGFLERGEK